MRVRGAVLRDGTRDTGCGLKAFRRDLFLALPYFDGLHRFLPALVRREGYDIGYVDVVDRPRRAGRSNYGMWDRLWVGILDLFGVWWLIRRRRSVPRGLGGETEMLIELSQTVGNYLHDVFVAKFQWWVLLGYVAQIMFTMRFVVQWIASERAGKMVMPIAFWFFSIGGGVLLLVYALYIRDPVFILGQGFGVFVYLRNLYFELRDRASRSRRREAASARRVALRLLCRRQRGEAALEIADQVVDVLEADVEAHRRPARRPLGRGADDRRSRTEWRGSRSRPTTRPCRTGRARRGRHAPPLPGPA